MPTTTVQHVSLHFGLRHPHRSSCKVTASCPSLSHSVSPVLSPITLTSLAILRRPLPLYTFVSLSLLLSLVFSYACNYLLFAMHICARWCIPREGLGLAWTFSLLLFIYLYIPSQFILWKIFHVRFFRKNPPLYDMLSLVIIAYRNDVIILVIINIIYFKYFLRNITYWNYKKKKQEYVHIIYYIRI